MSDESIDLRAYEDIGRELHDTSGAINLDPNDFQKLGKRWFDENKQKLTQVLCTSELLSNVVEQTDEKEAIAIIADALATVVIAVPPFTLARVVVRIGLTKICDSVEK